MSEIKEYSSTLDTVKMLFPHLKSVRDEEIVKALHIARMLGLNPIKKEVHLVPFNGQVQLVVSYTEYIKRAKHLLDGFEVNIGKDDIDMYAECVIYRKDWEHPFKWRVYLSEARKQTRSWNEMPMFMLKKVAIAQAFRLAFPEEIAELPLTMEETDTSSEQPRPIITQNPVPSQPAKKPMTELQKKKMFALFKDAGITTREQMHEFIKNTLGYEVESSKDLSSAEASKIIDELIKASQAIQEVESVYAETENQTEKGENA